MVSENPVVLVVDDEEVVHASIRRILSRSGFQIEGAFTAHEGLERMRSKNFAAVITDLIMPEINGLEMLDVMREEGMNLPTIMITGYPTVKTALKALRLGAVDYIPKPFTRQELLSPLNRALRRESDGYFPEEKSLEEEVQSEGWVRSGDRFALPRHSWAVYCQDGTVEVGVEECFLVALVGVESIECPHVDDQVEQGYPGIRLNSQEEVHAVFMPLSGRVIQVNQEVVDDPASLDSSSWVVRVLPNDLHEELRSLERRL
jgi:DNA-binding response OmpR family regulator